jgi:excisionase family DNA binding protein
MKKYRDDLLTASAAGRLLGVSADTIRYHARAGRLEAERPAEGMKLRLFKRADLLEFARRMLWKVPKA